MLQIFKALYVLLTLKAAIFIVSLDYFVNSNGKEAVLSTANIIKGTSVVLAAAQESPLLQSQKGKKKLKRNHVIKAGQVGFFKLEQPLSSFPSHQNKNEKIKEDSKISSTTLDNESKSTFPFKGYISSLARSLLLKPSVFVKSLIGLRLEKSSINIIDQIKRWNNKKYPRVNGGHGPKTIRDKDKLQKNTHDDDDYYYYYDDDWWYDDDDYYDKYGVREDLWDVNGHPIDDWLDQNDWQTYGWNVGDDGFYIDIESSANASFFLYQNRDLYADPDLPDTDYDILQLANVCQNTTSCYYEETSTTFGDYYWFGIENRNSFDITIEGTIWPGSFVETLLNAFQRTLTIVIIVIALIFLSCILCCLAACIDCSEVELCCGGGPVKRGTVKPGSQQQQHLVSPLRQPQQPQQSQQMHFVTAMPMATTTFDQQQKQNGYGSAGTLSPMGVHQNQQQQIQLQQQGIEMQAFSQGMHNMNFEGQIGIQGGGYGHNQERALTSNQQQQPIQGGGYASNQQWAPTSNQQWAPTSNQQWAPTSNQQWAPTLNQQQQPMQGFILQAQRASDKQEEPKAALF